LTYAEKVLALSRGVAEIHDGRRRPRIPTAVVVRSLLAMWLARLGSLNALEQTRPSPFWRRFLGAPLPSADTLGRVPERLAADSLREVLHQIYTRLKRNKALPATSHGLTALVLDGHETHASYHRHCPGCCVRLVGSEGQQRRQFYHRVVSAMLLSGDLRLWLDVEPQGPGEDEIAAGVRLLERVLDRYPRAFDVVLGDALYTDPRLYAVALGHGKDVLSVLKSEDRDLVKDARALFATLPPQALSDDCRAWDVSGLESWPQAGRAVRVVRTLEIRTRPAAPRAESEWLWVTTLSTHRACTRAIIELGHARWDIENQGFNEFAHRWLADHVYRHHPNALLSFWLLGMLAFNVFFAFARRNLQPEYRRRFSHLHLARCLAEEIYDGGLALSDPRAP
jgi:Transposase domain (DUF772)